MFFSSLFHLDFPGDEIIAPPLREQEIRPMEVEAGGNRLDAIVDKDFDRRSIKQEGNLPGRIFPDGFEDVLMEIIRAKGIQIDATIFGIDLQSPIFPFERQKEIPLEREFVEGMEFDRPFLGDFLLTS